MSTPSIPIAPIARRSRTWLLASVAGGVLALVLVIWLILSFLGGGEPRLNDNTVVLAKFISSSAFDQLPFDKQRQYYKVLDKRSQELDQLYKDRRLSDGEYRTGLEAAWLGKHLNHVEKYFALPPGQGRADYINKLLVKKARKPGTIDPDEIKTDETAAELRVESWPPSVREQWNTFHNAYHKEKKSRETPQTRPSGKK